MQNQANIKAVITADDRGSATVKKFGQNVEGLGTKAKNALKVATVATAAVTTAVVAFGVASVKAFTEAEGGIAQTNAVLKSTKGVAGVTAKAVADLSTSLQSVTKFSDEQVRSAQNMLLTFTSIGKDVFPQATKTVLDMSAALGQDLKSSSIQVGKALQDPVLGVTALRRVGVNFSKDQQEVIKKLVDTGQKAKAQALILKELKTEFGGSAEAAGKTFAGKLEILKNSLNDVQESIGQVIVNAITPLATKLSEFIASEQFQEWLVKTNEWIKIHLPLAINYLTQTVWPALVDVFNATWPVVEKIVVAFAKVTDWIISNKPVLVGLTSAFVALKVAMAVSSAVKAFQVSMASVKASWASTRAFLSIPFVMPALGVGAALASAYSVYKAVISIRDAIRAVNSAANATENANASISSAQRKAFDMINSGDPKKKKAGRQLLSDLTKIAGGYASGGFTGRGGVNEVAGVVHKGEYVVPQSQVDQASGKPMMGNTINITVQAGVMTGSEADMRKLSQMVADSMKQVAASRGMSTNQLLGVS